MNPIVSVGARMVRGAIAAAEKRGIKIFDQKTARYVEIGDYLNRFSLPGKTPILENIYDTIAGEFSKIDLILSKETETADEFGNKILKYEQIKDNPNREVLTLRPNALQTSSDLLYTIAYQTHAFRNSLVRIIREEGADKNIVLALEPINVLEYEFGQGYQIGGTAYLKLKEKSTGQILLLDYGDIIHLRLNPNDIFYGDRNDTFDLTNFVRIYDENLSALFNELKDSGTVRGIIKVGGPMAGAGFTAALVGDQSKIDKQKEILDRINSTSGGLLVLDSGEEWVNLNSPFKTMTFDEVKSFMGQLYAFKGINQAVIDGTATEAQMEVFFNKTIMPLIERLIEELNYKFLTKTARTKGQRIEYFKNPFEFMSVKDVIPRLYQGAMYFTQNEVRRLAFKLPPLPGGDILQDNKNFTKTGAGKQGWESGSSNMEGGDGNT